MSDIENFEQTSEELVGGDSKIGSFENKKTRQIGFEILRIIAIFLIACHHVMNHGGVMKNSSNTLWLRLLNSIFLISVNVFVLITGYFLTTSKITFKKIFKLWAQVVFYSVFAYLFVTLTLNKGSFSIKTFIRSFMPIIYNKYWFFTAYFLLYLISPFLNVLIKNLKQKDLLLFILGLLIVVFLGNKSYPIRSVVNFNQGYTVFWFVVLYFIAGYLRLYPLKLKRIVYLIIFIVSVAYTWICTIFKFKSNLFLRLIHSGISYDSYMAIIASVSIFLLFADIRCKNEKVTKSVSWISSFSFGIYLFHESSPLRNIIYFDWFKVQNIYNSAFAVWHVMYYALWILLLGFVVELLRRFIIYVVKKIYKLINRLILKNREKELSGVESKRDIV